MKKESLEWGKCRENNTATLRCGHNACRLSLEEVAAVRRGNEARGTVHKALLPEGICLDSSVRSTANGDHHCGKKIWYHFGHNPVFSRFISYESMNVAAML